jgi:tight adherence protein C
MNEMMILGVLIAISAGLITWSLWPTKKDGQDVIRRRMKGKGAHDDVIARRLASKQSLTKAMLKKVAPIAVRPVMPASAEEMTRLRKKLASAGHRAENAPTMLLASKTVLGIVVGLAGLIYGLNKGGGITSAMGPMVFGMAGGFMAPNLWLTMAIGKRMEQIRSGLPDSLDLLVISVESGLALDGAIQRVGDELKNVHPALSEEFQIATLESQMGIPRSEALNNMSDRTGVPEMKSLIAVVNQAERFGTSVAKALRNQAAALRTKRRQKAEERAQKTTVKLMAPLVLFIFPAIFVVLAGPAALRLIETMSSGGGMAF